MWIKELAKLNKNALILTLWMAVTPITVSSFITYYGLTNEAIFHNLEPWVWLIFFMVSSVMMGFALTPTTFMALFTGFFIEWWAAPGMIIAYTLASYLGFQLTKVIDKGKFIKTIRGMPGNTGIKVNKLMSGLKSNQEGIIILSRISPVLPFAIMNVVLPVSGIKLKPFLVYGMMGMLPRTLFFIWAGSQARALAQAMENPGNTDLNFWITTGLVIITFAGGIYYARKIFSRKLEDYSSKNSGIKENHFYDK